MDKTEALPTGLKETQKKERVSFRDKVIGGSAARFAESAGSLEGDKLGKVSGKQGDSNKPSVTFTDEARA
ncbi:hypothetical protein PIB30_113739, partial [Stylosanthes scabra]|nr:hypothetical protein [Stylosanthes scabra]